MDISCEKLKENCPIDKSCEWNFLYNSAYNSYNLPIYRCNQCNLQAYPPKEELDLKQLYSENYYKGTSNYTYKDERETEYYDSYVWDARIKNIRKFQNKGNFLDVGSSFGGFLSRAKRLGFSPYGVEVSEYAATYCEKRGIPVFKGEFLNSDYPKEFFTVITMIEVVEHLSKPDLVFSKCYSLLKEGGMLVIQTANFEGKQALKEGANYHYYLPGHLYYYSLSNLKKFLSYHGFYNFIYYSGVDFPLYAKLLKSRGSFKQIRDYFKWFKISYYHFKSTYFPGSTSSMVLYAFKPG
ncbi:MAG: class I SAM-dependent methyltransferase [Leptospiraceae bacterium]|nr:class I SAM-dependent methyltransferase [Leptospiraceae bacterium]MCP5497630.1 class I SAM-dependent methyltransferase [Leptospiraceae bacterium]